MPVLPSPTYSSTGVGLDLFSCVYHVLKRKETHSRNNILLGEKPVLFLCTPKTQKLNRKANERLCFTIWCLGGDCVVSTLSESETA